MDKAKIMVRVSCYAGYRGEETPRYFHIKERRIDIAEILDRWLSHDHRYFKVKDDHGTRYILRHDTASGQWELTLYDITQSNVSG
ncbi:MAG: hypothetical protein KQH63_00045 [Desulfobulbaceae bacterium]|nr:hypothetical protein [Desulfobulbaceae bacterium]